MVHLNTNVGLPPGVANAVARLIQERTFGRVLDLQTEFASQRIVIRGRAPSYYVKQVAIRAALDAIGSTTAGALDVQIQVVAPASS